MIRSSDSDGVASGFFSSRSLAAEAPAILWRASTASTSSPPERSRLLDSRLKETWPEAVILASSSDGSTSGFFSSRRLVTEAPAILSSFSTALRSFSSCHMRLEAVTLASRSDGGTSGFSSSRRLAAEAPAILSSFSTALRSFSSCNLRLETVTREFRRGLTMPVCDFCSSEE